MSSNPEDRLRAAAALRDLIHTFAGHDADAETLAAVAESATRLAGDLRTAPKRDRFALMAKARESAPADGKMFATGGADFGFQDRAVGGWGNPASLDIEIDFQGDEGTEVVGTFILRKAFEGAPGRAHGGIVLAAFDDVTGCVIGRVGEPAFTGELSVRFEAPVPVDEPLTIHTRCEGRERRKLFITGELLTAAGEVVATCKAIYVTVDPSIFAGAGDPR